MAETRGGDASTNGVASPGRKSTHGAAVAAKKRRTRNSDAGGSATPQYVASLSLGEERTALSPRFAEAVNALEKSLKMPLWFLLQNGSPDAHDMCSHIEELFFRARHELPTGKPIALLLESPGGSASAAYAIAKMLQRHCGSYTVIVAQWAKSAATLLSLGASEIIMAEHAQLGPIDAQLEDYDREERLSALNETQAVERLHAAALEALDKTVLLLVRRTKKRIDSVLPHAMRFTADLMRPLFEKVDVVQYTSRQRTLKVAEEYAVRLMGLHHPSAEAKAIARHLVERYPEHGFMIDFEEALEIGLTVKSPTEEQDDLLDQILLDIKGMNAFGRVVQL